jgi:hypothetical protein
MRWVPLTNDLHFRLYFNCQYLPTLLQQIELLQWMLDVNVNANNVEGLRDKGLLVDTNPAGGGA